MPDTSVAPGLHGTTSGPFPRAQAGLKRPQGAGASGPALSSTPTAGITHILSCYRHMGPSEGREGQDLLTFTQQRWSVSIPPHIRMHPPELVFG